MNKIELKQIFLVINNCYPNFTIDDVKTEIWFSVLKGISFARAQENLREHIKTSSFVPTPADIIKYDLLKMVSEMYKLEDEKEEVFREFTLNGGDGEKFDFSPWDTKIAEIKNLLPPDPDKPKDKRIAFRNKEVDFQRWEAEGNDPDLFDWS